MLHVLVGQAAFEEDTRDAAAQGGTVSWIVPKKAKPGELIFLFFPHAGFLGRGVILSEPQSALFGARRAYEADVGNIALFESPIPLDAVAVRLSAWPWTTYPRSYTTPPAAVADELLKILETHDGLGDTALPEEVPTGSVYAEGAVQRILVNRYERDRGAREACIKHYGTRCHVCGFDFAAKYSDVMAGFIHVHHLKPLSSIGADYKIDPIQDLRPVCPNCHAVLHRREPPYSLEEVNQLIKEAEGPNAASHCSP